MVSTQYTSTGSPVDHVHRSTCRMSQISVVFWKSQTMTDFITAGFSSVYSPGFGLVLVRFLIQF